MRRNLFALSICCFLGVAALLALHGNKPGKTEMAVSGGAVAVDFVGPDLMDRDISTMIKPGQPWRLGADKPTTLDTPVALQFGDSRIPAGKYVLRALFDNDSKWWLEIQDSARNFVAKIPLKKFTTRDSAKNMVIVLEGRPEAATLRVHWGTQALESNFSVAE